MLALLRRRLLLILLVAVASAAVALGLSLRQPDEYQSTASLLFRDSGVTSLIGDDLPPEQGDADRIAETNLRLVTQDNVARLAAQRRRHHETIDSVHSAVGVAQQGQSDLVGVTATEGTPKAAQSMANTYAQAFIDIRREALGNQIERARQRIQSEIDNGQTTPGRRLQLRNDASQLRLLSSLQTAGVEIAERAPRPTSRSSPKPRRNVLIGAFVGLLLGVALAISYDQLDRRLRRPADAEELFGLPLLASVRQSKALRRRPARLEGLAPADLEAFRRLRTALRHYDLGGEVRSVAITSASPESGKTTVAAYLAHVSAHAGSRVLIVEADTREPRLGEQLGLQEAVPQLVPLLRAKNGRLEDAVEHVRIGESPGFDVILAEKTSAADTDLLDTARMQELLQLASQQYDLVILDTAPATLAAETIPLLRQVDGVVIVSRIGRDTRDVAGTLADEMAKVDARAIGVVATFTADGASAYGYGS